MLSVFEPQMIAIPALDNNLSARLYTMIDQTLGDATVLQPVDRQYFTEVSGLELMQQLAFKEDFEAVKASVSFNYFAVCCFSAVSLDGWLETVFT
jgi:DNA mismatch repair protein MSH4